MKYLFFLFSIVFFASCNDAKVESATSDNDSANKSTVNLPYQPVYAADWKIGNEKNVETALRVWKAWDDGNLAAAKDAFADTLTMVLADGHTISGQIDTMLAMGQSERAKFSQVQSRVITYIPVKSDKMNEEWVSIWGVEVNTSKSGKVDSMGLQESYRFNKDGKIDLSRQYRMILSPPANMQ